MTTETGTFTPTDEGCAHTNRVAIYSRERVGPDFYCPDCGLDSNPPPEPPVFTATEVRELIERERRAAQVEVVRAIAARAERASTNVHHSAEWLEGIANHIERGEWSPRAQEWA